ncbi:helix-turn-helix domain-containing protein [Bacillus sp. SD088]|uniref:helix-turn-helix domain-containing protein n=1 Tax=Bacillus sp. SD088 TaxID=2782012 RepID=UPI001A9625EE|nr:AraC family transcriptional regulator [Bacillus sp. SD088]MBO0993283.1 helix-turn-helix transcriptional regulator [Bacillus sp. SD088]
MKAQSLEMMIQYIENLQVHMIAGNLTKVKPNWQKKLSLEPFNRLYFILEGEGRIKIDETVYTPLPGQLFIMPSGTRHSYSTISDDTYLKFWCHFTATIGEMDLFKAIHVPHFLDVQEKQKTAKQFNMLIDLYHSDQLSAPIKIKSILFDFISQFIEQSVLKTDFSSVHNINTVLKYIDQHLSEKIKVETLAELANLHPNYFMHYFKSILGLSPIAFINQKKMKQAQYLLQNTDQTIAEVAEQVGLDIYYFSKVFKRFTGFSPTKYRQMNREP